MAAKKAKVRKAAVFVSPNHTKVEITVRRFVDAPDEHRFVLNDGRLLKNLKEFADSLEHMSDDVFSHHVSSSKNDFSNWLKGVLCEGELAEDLQRIDNKLHMQIAVLKHIARKAF